LTLGVNDQIVDADTYASLIIGTHNGTVVRVRDVRPRVSSVENVKVGGWVNGKTSSDYRRPAPARRETWWRRRTA